nr:lysine-rich arabinogalactan protein 19-like [Aegilops tauschii subsp. strangulata]
METKPCLTLTAQPQVRRALCPYSPHAPAHIWASVLLPCAVHLAHAHAPPGSPARKCAPTPRASAAPLHALHRARPHPTPASPCSGPAPSPRASPPPAAIVLPPDPLLPEAAARLRCRLQASAPVAAFATTR